MEDPSSPEVIELPGIGTVQAISSRAESSTFFYKYVSFLSPGVTVRCQVKVRYEAVEGEMHRFRVVVVYAGVLQAKADPKLVESNVIHETEVAGFKAEEFTTFQNFAVSTYVNCVSRTTTALKTHIVVSTLCAAAPYACHGQGWHQNPLFCHSAKGRPRPLACGAVWLWWILYFADTELFFISSGVAE